MTDNKEVPSVVYLHALPSELLQGFQKPQMVVLVKHLCSRNAVFGAECGLDTLNDSLSLTDWRNSLLNAHRRALVRAQTAIVDDENDNDDVNAELGDTLPVLDFTFVLDLLNAHPDKALTIGNGIGASSCAAGWFIVEFFGETSQCDVATRSCGACAHAGGGFCWCFGGDFAASNTADGRPTGSCTSSRRATSMASLVSTPTCAR